MSPEDRPRILVVDDDEDTRQLIAFALGEHRYAVPEVADDKAALAALRSGISTSSSPITTCRV